MSNLQEATADRGVEEVKVGEGSLDAVVPSEAGAARAVGGLAAFEGRPDFIPYPSFTLTSSTIPVSPSGDYPYYQVCVLRARVCVRCFARAKQHTHIFCARVCVRSAHFARGFGH
jgi:hypothetical protein